MKDGGGDKVYDPCTVGSCIEGLPKSKTYSMCPGNTHTKGGRMQACLCPSVSRKSRKYLSCDILVISSQPHVCMQPIITLPGEQKKSLRTSIKWEAVIAWSCYWQLGRIDTYILWKSFLKGKTQRISPRWYVKGNELRTTDHKTYEQTNHWLWQWNQWEAESNRQETYFATNR